MSSFGIAGNGAGAWRQPTTSPEVLAARAVLYSGLSRLRGALSPTAINEMMNIGMRGDGGPQSRTRRSPTNEGPGRQLPGPKPVGGRVGAPARPGIPAQNPEHLDGVHPPHSAREHRSSRRPGPLTTLHSASPCHSGTVQSGRWRMPIDRCHGLEILS